MREFSKIVQENLKYYVYALYKPNEELPFYIGKGQGNRVFAHIKEAEELLRENELSEDKISEKLNIIIDLLKKNQEPRIEILRHGLEDEKEALVAESVAIDLLNNSLSNLKSGYKSRQYGRKDLNRILHDYEKDFVEISEPSILIRITEYFNPDKQIVQLYDRTRCAWILNLERAGKAKYVFAVYQSKILEVYKVAVWIPANLTMHASGQNMYAKEVTNDEKPQRPRVEFVGQLAEKHIREKYRGKYVKDYKPGSQNPCTYNNI